MSPFRGSAEFTKNWTNFRFEVDEDHVAGLSRKAAEEYFRVMNQDAKK